MSAANIIPLDQVDSALIEALLDRAFEPERHRRTANKVREGTDWLPALSFAAIDENDDLVGTIQCWPVALTDSAGKRHPLIMVGPVAVAPDRQDQGEQPSGSPSSSRTASAATNRRCRLPLGGASRSTWSKGLQERCR